MRLYHVSDLRSSPEHYQTPLISFTAPHLPTTIETILNYITLIKAPLLAHRYSLKQGEFDTTLALLSRFYGVVPDSRQKGGIHFDASRMGAALHQNRHNIVRGVYRDELHRLGLGHAIYAQARVESLTRVIPENSAMRPENHADTPQAYLQVYEWLQTINRLQSIFNPLSVHNLMSEDTPEDIP